MVDHPVTQPCLPLSKSAPKQWNIWPNLGGILEQSTRVTPIGKLNTLVNKIERLHSTEGSNGPPIEMGWKPGNHVLKGSGKSLSAPDPGRWLEQVTNSSARWVRPRAPLTIRDEVQRTIGFFGFSPKIWRKTRNRQPNSHLCLKSSELLWKL